MYFVLAFWLTTFLACGVCFQQLHTDKSFKKSFFKKVEEKIKKIFKRDISERFLLKILDNLKCLFFVCLGAFLFNNKYITDITAIVAHLSSNFPIWHKFKSDNKNFISVIITGFVLDEITGISMLFAFLIGAKKSGYTSVAITSAMLAGIFKTAIHIFMFNNNDYVEAVFFIFFGCLAISRNKKTLIYICEKAVPEDFKFYKKKKKEEKKETHNGKKHHEVKCEKKEKKDAYPNKYKKFYKNNKKYEKIDIKAEKRDMERERGAKK